MSCCSPNRKEESVKDSCCAPKKEQPSQNSCCSVKKETSQENQSNDQSNSSCCATPSKEKKVISRQMTIEEILGMFPYKAQKLSQEITNAGLHCVGCHAATWETLELGMMNHGKTNEQIDELVRRLNALLEEPTDLSSIAITPRGAAKFLEILHDEGKQGWGMRFSEEMAGCNGFEYVLDFSEKAEDDDETFVSNGIDIHVKKAKVSRLVGSEIDFVDGLRGSGFKISNPNVRSSCGCGTSHGY